MTGRRVTLQTKGAPLAFRSVSTTLDKSGNFCFEVASGTHHIQVQYSFITFRWKSFVTYNLHIIKVRFQIFSVHTLVEY